MPPGRCHWCGTTVSWSAEPTSVSGTMQAATSLVAGLGAPALGQLRSVLKLNVLGDFMPQSLSSLAEPGH